MGETLKEYRSKEQRQEVKRTRVKGQKNFDKSMCCGWVVLRSNIKKTSRSNLIGEGEGEGVGDAEGGVKMWVMVELDSDSWIVVTPIILLSYY